MTRTEDRLVAALASAAAAVQVDRRPLVAPGDSQPRTTRSRRRRAWLAITLPVAASLPVIALVVVLTGQAPSASVQTAAYIGGSLPHVPAFYVDSSGLTHEKLRVISLATGKVTSTASIPDGSQDITFLAEQPQTGRYLAGFIGNRPGLALYRFRLTGAGQITKLIPIERVLPKVSPESVTALALSPDGTRLALAVGNSIPAPRGEFDAKIVLLNLRTGKHKIWDDGLTDRAHFPQITSGAWTPDGRGLVFASHTCRVRDLNGCTWDFRELTLSDGRLRVGPVLLHQTGMNGETQWPEVSPDGRSVLESEPRASAGSILVRISLSTGRRTVLFRSPRPLEAGPDEGNFVFIGQQVSGNDWRAVGWVDADGFHPARLPISS